MSSTGYFKREELIGKSVVSKNAEIIGTVLDLAISTDGRLAIQVQRKSGSSESGDLFISADQIQAVRDVILLKADSDGTGKLTSNANPGPSAVAVAATANTNPGTSVSPPPPPGAMTQSKTCQKCGYVNSPNAKFCIKCGASLI